MTTFRLSVSASNETVTYVVRRATDDERNPRGTDTQWVAFVDGGALSDGEDFAIFENAQFALAFVAIESLKVAAELA